jgi:ubiquinone biosynthesis protein
MFDSLKKEVRDVKRLEQVIRVLAKHEIKLIRQGKRISPEALRLAFDELGGSFVKLAQLLSLRPDLIPTEYCDELGKLTDSVRPISKKKIQEVLDKDNIKLKISEKPIGSASIAQVHTARIDNKKVVVKVLKPGVKEKFESDLDLLEKAAKLIDKKLKPKHFSARLIHDEFSQYTREELNLMHEYDNIKKVLAKKHLPTVNIPKPIKKYCTKNALVMDFVPGKKILELKKRPKKWGDIIAMEFWEQIFEHGVFHADPHPGNILIEKKVGLIDWGIIGELDEDMRSNLKNIFYGLILFNMDMITNAVIKLNVTNTGINRIELRHDLKKYISKYYDKNLEQLRLNEILKELFEIVRKHDFYWGKNYVLLMKCLITIEGTGLEYRKDFNMFEVAKKYIENKTKTDIKTVALKQYKEFVNTMMFLKRVPEEVSLFFDEEIRQERLLKNIKEDVEGMNDEIKNVGHELILVIGAAAIIIASVLLMDYEINGLPYLSFLGFALAAAMILNIIHLLRK